MIKNRSRRLLLTIVMAASLVMSSAVPVMAETSVPDDKPAAASYSYNKIKLTWDALKDVDGYQIYRATSKKGTYKKAATVKGDRDTTYIDTGLTCGKTYFYKVRAYKKISGKTVYSKLSSVMSAFPKPAKTKNLRVQYTGYPGFFKLEWDKVSGASGYQIWAKEKSDGKWRTYYNYGGTKFHPDTKGEVTPAILFEKGATKAFWFLDDSDKEYQFRVRAYKVINGRRVYGAYSDTFKLEPTLTAEDVTNYMTDYIRREYPDFVFYYYRDGYPLTPEFGTVGYDIVWSNTVFSRYDSIERVGKSLEGTLDLLFSLQMSANGKIGGGCPYAEINEDGLLKVWLLY